MVPQRLPPEGVSRQGEAVGADHVPQPSHNVSRLKAYRDDLRQAEAKLADVSTTSPA